MEGERGGSARYAKRTEVPNAFCKMPHGIAVLESGSTDLGEAVGWKPVLQGVMYVLCVSPGVAWRSLWVGR